MTSAFAQDEFCFTISGASSPLPTPYSVAKPATATADPAQYQSAVATWFVNFLDVHDWGVCGENGSLAVHMADANADATAFVNVEVPTILGVASPTSLAATSNTASLVGSQSSTLKGASGGLSTRAKAAVGLVVSVVGLALVLPGLALWYRYRKQRAARMERKIQEKLETENETEMEVGGLERNLSM